MAVLPEKQPASGLGKRDLLVFGLGFVAGGFATLVVFGLGWLVLRLVGG